MAMCVAGSLVAPIRVSCLVAEPISSQAASARPPVPRDTVKDSQMAAQLAAITTDTGDFAPGHRDFARYATPLQCLEGARLRRDVSRRTLEAQASLDTLRLTPERDTLPAGAVAVARACGARFTAAGTAVAELPALLELAVLGGNDSLAQTVLTRRLAVAPTDSARRQVFLETLDVYLQAEPARIQAADALVARMDALGRPALVARTDAHARLLHFGEAHMDRAQMRREGERVIALVHDMTPAEVTQFGGNAVVTTFEDLMAIARVDHPDSIPMVAQRFQQEVRRPSWTEFLKKPEFQGIEFAMLDSAISYLGGGPVNSGAPTPRVQAEFWFPAGDTVQPAPGYVSLIVNSVRGGNCLYSLDQNFGSDYCNDGGRIALLRRWLRQYRATGLRVTVVVPDYGYVLMRGPEPPATVAQVFKKYFLDYLRLPVTLAVQTPAVAINVPAPDGRVFFDWMALTKQYQPASKKGSRSDPAIVVLTGRDGRMLYKGKALDDPVLEALLARELTASRKTLGDTSANSTTNLSPSRP